MKLGFYEDSDLPTLVFVGEIRGVDDLFDFNYEGVQGRLDGLHSRGLCLGNGALKYQT